MQEASQQDVQLLEQWIDSDPENKACFEQIRETWHSIELEKELDQKQVDHDLNFVLERSSLAKKYKDSKDSGANTSPIRWPLKVAATFVLGFLASWLLYQYQPSNYPEQIAYAIISTLNGNSTNVTLPDGSEIWLNAGSTLKYPQQFSKNEREVYLEGEAFFKVAKDRERQFLVKTHDITVKVFGTSFNVKSYPEENTIETTLVEGSISIYNHLTNGNVESGKEIKLEPNQRIVLYKKQESTSPAKNQPGITENVPEVTPKLILSKRVDTNIFTSWKDGKLIFKSEPLENLAKILERKYNVNIHFKDDGIGQFRFSGTIEKETIEQVMVAIKLASSIDYYIEDGEVTISKM